jgi:probable phosphoglycerate mutase
VPPLTERAFWYLRHGETDWNAQGLAQGNVDIPLNETGLAQARDAAPLLAHRGIATIISSPLSRARVTAEIVAETLGLPVQIDADLREVAFGTLEGQPMAAGWYGPWMAGSATPEGAEPFEALRDRAVAAINRCLTHPPVVLVVAHGALFRALRSAMGHDPDTRLANAHPVFCEPAWVLRSAGER